ncbi:MAG: hypothetical protein HETSPECPRED_003969 [Heterodermia speciosa]|uniref:Uncharacterized protein n=1 Tax=Heterodermia speciosa TaxID=116794 RepID=A0A8H3F6R7_9LECA|nr:MAG: hypothetical protein HETSPECPRED_003969 [Heterodermia speciosa]
MHLIPLLLTLSHAHTLALILPSSLLPLPQPLPTPPPNTTLPLPLQKPYHPTWPPHLPSTLPLTPTLSLTLLSYGRHHSLAPPPTPILHALDLILHTIANEPSSSSSTSGEFTYHKRYEEGPLMLLLSQRRPGVGKEALGRVVRELRALMEGGGAREVDARVVIGGGDVAALWVAIVEG